jgi:hypothetical protein
MNYKEVVERYEVLEKEYRGQQETRRKREARISNGAAVMHDLYTEQVTAMEEKNDKIKGKTKELVQQIEGKRSEFRARGVLGQKLHRKEFTANEADFENVSSALWAGYHKHKDIEYIDDVRRSYRRVPAGMESEPLNDPYEAFSPAEQKMLNCRTDLAEYETLLEHRNEDDAHHKMQLLKGRMKTMINEGAPQNKEVVDALMEELKNIKQRVATLHAEQTKAEAEKNKTLQAINEL